ncbi:dihydrolipoyl dehydrogenase [Candidatus Poribacteria bacterium]|nr:dihydrolipoyl dehydrogenase [Candidatus Poribacteria bacterium]MYH83728.1 dihydrolipoyl dehydrogenase [Candidatus Poribacteria bacterium]MYK92434.1 dihydrolipoyl dehydrogenase [Candidatus Poribacteria bacterium]
MSTYDVGIIGGGPGGYVAAIKAAQLGGSVCLIEKGEWGGTCLNRGCIPTKTLFAVANLATQVQEAPDFGVHISGEATIDYPQVLAHKNAVIQQLTGGIAQLLKANKVDTLNGIATLTDRNTISVSKSDGTTEELHAKNVIIATGSEPAEPPVFEIDENQVLTTTGILNLTELPESLMIVGGGVSGCEFAAIFNALGCKVTVLELLPTILATEDVQVIRHIQLFMKRKGITIHTGAELTHVKKSDESVTAVLASGEEITAEKMLVSIGRRYNTEGIGLEKVGVRTDGGKIVVDTRLQTNIPGIYAVGDVASRYLLAHVASAEGKIAAQNCLGNPAEMDYQVIPWCIFTLPEIGHVGMTEKEATDEGYEVKIGRFPYAANGKALGLRETDGFVKTVSDADSGDILGVHIVGAQASTLIHEAAVAVRLGASAADIAHTVHAHPTLSEMVMESAEAADDRAIHSLH